MLEWYILGVIGFSLGFDQHRSIITSETTNPYFGYTGVLFDVTAWIGGMATLLILPTGFFYGAWWWPLLAMIIGTVTNYAGRTVVTLEYRFIVSIFGVLVGFGSVFIFFL